MKITNQISIFRFICALAIGSLFIWWLKTGKSIALTAILWTFIIGCISDFIDGYIARKKNMVTKFGEIIDPIADKALINTALIVILAFSFLTRNGKIMLVVFASVTLMLIRDILVDAAKIYLAANNKKVAASKWGKIKTITQMIAIITTFTTLSYDKVVRIKTIHLSWLFVIATLTSLISGYNYIMSAWRTKK